MKKSIISNITTIDLYPNASTSLQRKESGVPIVRKGLHVESYNDFDPLRHVIVGIADNQHIPEACPASNEKIPAGSPMRGGKAGRRTQESIDIANECLNDFAKLLEARNIIVDRPGAVDWHERIITPDFTISSGFGVMPPRDCLLTMGKTMLMAPMSFRSRYFEYLAYVDLLREYFESDPNCLIEQAPRPRLSDESFRMDYVAAYEFLSDEETMERSLRKEYSTKETDILFDAADVMRLGKDVFVQHGLTTNLAGIHWLKRKYEAQGYRIHTLSFEDNHPIHIDATFCPLRPGLMLLNPNRPLFKGQREIFEKNDWEIVEAVKPSWENPPALCYSSTWLSMNTLILDHKTVCVEATETAQMEQFDKLGFDVIPVAMRDAYAFGGGLHCATADVWREGTCEDYFPNQFSGTHNVDHWEY
ncbi:serine/threonine protein kinase [Psychromonas sp. CD1]|uniref:serine/threonine protein kinase n=1 Tax=Psychromonas sp. CD1 TaxID=1979839 RepID=UPI00215192EA|nr:serine/threonine protein kinase [Psychromonas sp. CD1]